MQATAGQEHRFEICGLMILLLSITLWLFNIAMENPQ